MRSTYGWSRRARSGRHRSGAAARGGPPGPVPRLGEQRGATQRLEARPCVGIAAAGHNEYGDGGERLDLAQAFQDEIPVAGGEADVEEDQVGMLAVDDR